MNIELRKWSVEDKEVLIKMCNSIDRSFYLIDYLIHIQMHLLSGG